MPYLQVRDFPSELYQQLKQRAKSEHRSVSQQTIIAINEHVALASARAKAGSPAMASPVVGHPAPSSVLVGTEERIEKRKRLFARIKATPKLKDCPSSESIVELIRSERDSR